MYVLGGNFEELLKSTMLMYFAPIERLPVKYFRTYKYCAANVILYVL